MKINIFSPKDHDFLARTARIAKKPKQLYCLGTLPSGDAKVAAIVGSRRPTTYGRGVTETIAGTLARSGVVVVSGLALGVDGIAHRATLDAGGITIAVLASSVDDPTPRTNRELARNILQNGGALISEYEPGYQPMQYKFLERNRIVSALSDIIIVTEAAARSGTLSTVSHALEQGKTVMVVPGNITSPMSAGCNQLIKQGAVPILDPQDILDEFGIKGTDQADLIHGDNEHETVVIDLIRSGIQEGDEILTLSKLSSSDFNQTMTMLEIKGSVQSLGANRWSL